MNLTSKILASIACLAFIGPAWALDAKIKVLRDIAYGPDSAQRIDVYLPEPQPTNAPIIAIVHGGAWVFGGVKVEVLGENLSHREINETLGRMATTRNASRPTWPRWIKELRRRSA